MEQITASELKNQLCSDQKIIIIDVRESWEYEEQQLHHSAQNFPLGDLPQAISQLSNLKNTPFVVHCRTGTRSNQAQKYLTQNGFTKVINLAGGIEAYLAL